jgi:hypothetical protein
MFPTNLMASGACPRSSIIAHNRGGSRVLPIRLKSLCTWGRSLCVWLWHLQGLTQLLGFAWPYFSLGINVFDCGEGLCVVRQMWWEEIWVCWWTIYKCVCWCYGSIVGYDGSPPPPFMWSIMVGESIVVRIDISNRESCRGVLWGCHWRCCLAREISFG